MPSLSLPRRRPAARSARAAVLVAALAAPLAACGGDVVVRGSDGAGLPIEARLSAGAEADAARSAAAWRILGDGVGTGTSRVALVTAADLTALSADKIATAARNNAYGAATDFRYRETRDWLTRLTGPDRWRTGPWRHDSDRNQTVTLHTNSGRMQSSHDSDDEAGMAVTLRHNGAGRARYGLWYVHTSALSPGTFDSWSLDSGAADADVQLWSDGGKKGALFRRTDSDGKLWAAVTTDSSGAADTDWLATGVWAWTPTDTTAADRFQFGVFADGGDIFRRNLVGALAGEATYTGDASGVWTRVANGARRNDFFEARATLNADFSANPSDAGHGFISGRIHDIAVGGSAVAGSPEITLYRASVADEEHTGALFGNVSSMTFGGNVLTGRWSGQFFGAPADGATGAAKLPTSAAGTFGVARSSRETGETLLGDAAEAFAGAFGAHRTAWTNTPERPDPDNSRTPVPLDILPYFRFWH